MLTKGMNEKDLQSAEKVARQVSIDSIDHTGIRTRAVSDLPLRLLLSPVFVKSCLTAREDLHKILIPVRTELF